MSGAARSSWGSGGAAPIPGPAHKHAAGLPLELSAPAQPVYSRGGSADGPHRRGLLGVIGGFIRKDFNVVIPGKKGKRLSL